MCKFCEYGEPISEKGGSPFSWNGETLKIIGGELHLFVWICADEDDVELEEIIRVEYCPMCGRKLWL